VEYKELPAFESVDEFKVGDKINVYDGKELLAHCHIQNIEGEIIEVFKSCYIHYKQCRKLKEVDDE